MAELPRPLQAAKNKRFGRSCVFTKVSLDCCMSHFPPGSIKESVLCTGLSWGWVSLEKLPMYQAPHASEGHEPCQLQQKVTLRRLVHLARISQLCGKLVGDQARPDWETLKGHMPPSCRAGRVSRSWLILQADNIAFHVLAQEGMPIPHTNHCLIVT